MKLIIKEGVYDDLTAIVNWYENQSANLGVNFLEEWENTLKVISKNPSIFQLQYKEFRHSKILRFPYLIIFEIDNSEVIVYAVIHSYRKPAKRYKKRRKIL